MTPTPEDIIEFELLHAEGHMPKAATPGRLVKALTDAGYEIRERGVLYAGPLRATAQRDAIKVEHRDGVEYCYPVTVRMNGPIIECCVGDTGS